MQALHFRRKAAGIPAAKMPLLPPVLGIEWQDTVCRKTEALRLISGATLHISLHIPLRNMREQGRRLGRPALHSGKWYTIEERGPRQGAPYIFRGAGRPWRRHNPGLKRPRQRAASIPYTPCQWAAPPGKAGLIQDGLDPANAGSER